MPEPGPALLAAPGVGPDNAAALLVAAGDNPDRISTEAAFAALCGTSPVQASSGRIVRDRLNRGRNRQANNALWRIAINRIRYDPGTIAYTKKRQADGKTRREIIRCLKRHITREIYRLLTSPHPTPDGTDLRSQRNQARITLTHAATELRTHPPSSQHSNEASATTTSSIPDINNSSPDSTIPAQPLLVAPELRRPRLEAR